jgi:hypothetical protein
MFRCSGTTTIRGQPRRRRILTCVRSAGTLNEPSAEVVKMNTRSFWIALQGHSVLNATARMQYEVAANEISRLHRGSFAFSFPELSDLTKNGKSLTVLELQYVIWSRSEVHPCRTLCLYFCRIQSRTSILTVSTSPMMRSCFPSQAAKQIPCAKFRTKKKIRTEGALMEKCHYIHSRGGLIGGDCDTASRDIDAIIEAARHDPRKHIVLHFHGGLVSKIAGLAIADKLLPVYSPSAQLGGYPVFFVWESGAWETIRNNLTELADEPVFAQLLRKVLQYALEQLGGLGAAGTGRSILPGTFGSGDSAVRAELDSFWAMPNKTTIPFREFNVMANAAQARSASAALSEDEIRADLEGDAAFLSSLATLPDLPPGTRSSFGRGHNAVERRSAFSELACQEFSKKSATRGLVELYLVARYIARVLRNILRRYSAGRDHGLYATCVEEIIRGFRVGGSELNEWAKALQWNRMKKDTEDAFGTDSNLCAGTALLMRLKTAFATGFALDRITLVGHSTGAIYIAHWLANSRRYLPETLKQDVVFLAPAITYDQFAQTLRDHGSLVGKFRMFAMKDEFERDDQVWGHDEELKRARDWRRFVYPSSLLYLVSGILESSHSSEGAWVDEPDMPLVGMERFFSNLKTYPDLDFPSIKEVRVWLKRPSNSLVWSRATGQAAGLNSASVDHGAFDDDVITIQSLRHIVEIGF